MKIYQKLSLLTLVMSSLIAIPVFAKEEVTQVKINQEVIQMPENLDLKEGLIPLRWFANTMGASDVSWEKGTVTVEVDQFLDQQKYTNYQRGIEADSQVAFPLPTRLEDFEFSYERTWADLPMLNSHPITLNIMSQGVSMPYALYDYKMIEDRLHVSKEWLNTLFLADVKINDNQELEISYMKAEELKEQIGKIENMLKPVSAGEAVTLWVRGQQVRSGALQYVALSDELKQKALPKISEQLWVTGGSSPSLGEASILSVKEVDENTFVYSLGYKEMLQGQVWNEMEQKVTISKEVTSESSHWLITNVENNQSYYSVIPDEAEGTSSETDI